MSHNMRRTLKDISHLSKGFHSLEIVAKKAGFRVNVFCSTCGEKYKDKEDKEAILVTSECLLCDHVRNG